jgi:peptide deformylase
LDLINPTIEVTNDLVAFDEGCLSFPGQSVKTHRFNEIVVSTGLEDSRERVAATGLIAVCIQHETDHLDGVLMMDRAIKSQ